MFSFIRIFKNIFDKNNIEVIPMKLRHARTLGGSFHCVTLDTLREN